MAEISIRSIYYSVVFVESYTQKELCVIFIEAYTWEASTKPTIPKQTPISLDGEDHHD